MNTHSKTSIIQHNKSYCFPQCTSLSLCGETIPVKDLAGSIKYTVNTARQTLSHWIQWINH